MNASASIEVTPANFEGELRCALPAGIHLALESCEEVRGERGVTLPPVDMDPAPAHFHPLRRLQYEAGRRCAARALRAAGSDVARVARSAEGAPIWPAGYTGSISHLDSMAIAIAAPDRVARALGADIERCAPRRGPMRRLPAAVFGPDEQSRLGLLSSADRSLAERVIVSAKESIYKALFPLAGVRLFFRDVSVSTAAGAAGEGAKGRFATALSSRLGPVVAARLFPTVGLYFLRGELVITLFVSLPASSGATPLGGSHATLAV